MLLGGPPTSEANTGTLQRCTAWPASDVASARCRARGVRRGMCCNFWKQHGCQSKNFVLLHISGRVPPRVLPYVPDASPPTQSPTAADVHYCAPTKLVTPFHSSLHMFTVQYPPDAAYRGQTNLALDLPLPAAGTGVSSRRFAMPADDGDTNQLVAAQHRSANLSEIWRAVLDVGHPVLAPVHGLSNKQKRTAKRERGVGRGGDRTAF